MIKDELQRLRELIQLSTDLAEVKDLDVLMERLLQSARKFVNCDAGSIYIKEGDFLKFSYTQNDTQQARLKTGQKLIYNTFSVPINNLSISGYVALTGETLNIPDAYKLSSSVPFSHDKSYDESARYRTLSILTIPLKKRDNQIIGVLQLINAMDGDNNVIAFDPEMEPYVNYFASSATGALERAQLMRAILLRMISMAELRDPKETANHVNRVGACAVEIFEAWAKMKKYKQADIDKQKDVLRMAAMLHDVGKIAISDIILKKPGRLDTDEFETMKLHTIYGARLFRNPYSEFEEAARVVALNHHERFDGTGYPGHVDPFTGEAIHGNIQNGKLAPKKGEEIPLFGRIVAVSDVFDALSSQRCYKEAWTEEHVCALIRQEKGKHFDPEIVDSFFASLPNIRSVYKRYE
ncbi:MAG: HD domain-containing protein [Candidatus Latescibacteria bacterium]|nr:HD domain-containing protein [Candidatus Latescibacterota bacterium]